LKASPHLKDLSAKRPKFLPRNDTIRLWKDILTTWIQFKSSTKTVHCWQ
jgi:hypothetical protein